MAQFAHDFDEVKRRAREQAEEIVDRQGMVATSPFTQKALLSAATRRVRIKQFRMDDASDVAEMEEIMTRAAIPTSGIVLRREDLGRDSSGCGIMILNWIELDMSDYIRKAKESRIEEVENFILSDKRPVTDRHPTTIPSPPNDARVSKHMMSIDEIIAGLEAKEREAEDILKQSPDLKEFFPDNTDPHKNFAQAPGSYEPVSEEALAEEEKRLKDKHTPAMDDNDALDFDVEGDGGMI